ncbi:MAG: hypothetical protein MUP86_01125 [Dehalococcoidia bacterium]|nr:hypothetical protein [Dehalococcoidia bacterium]
MKLAPLLRFWGRKRTEEESDLLDGFPEETLQLPPEDQPTDSAEEEVESEEENQEEEGKTGDAGGDNLLNVFMSVDEEFVDNSALMNDIEDVPAAELLEELRTLAAAFNVRPQRSAGTPESEA